MLSRFAQFGLIYLCGAGFQLYGFNLYVSNERSGTVTIIDSESLQVVSSIPVGKRPRGIHLSPDGSRLYMALSGSPRMGPGADPERARTLVADKAADGIGVIDTATGRFLGKFSVGSDPEEFAISPDGESLVVSNEDVAAASVVGLADQTVKAVVPVSEEPEGIGINPVTGIAYVTCEEKGEIFAIHPDRGRAVASFAVGGRPRSVAFLPDGSRAYIPSETESAVYLADARRHEVIRIIPLEGKGLRPMGAALGPDGAAVFVSTGRGNTVEVIDTARNEVIASIPVGNRPWGLATSPDGSRLYTANGISNDISVIDVTSRREIARVSSGGEGPWGIAVGR